MTPSPYRSRYGVFVDDDLSPRNGPVDLSVVVVTHESGAFLRPCLASLHALTDTIRRELIVVDNASTDGTPEVVAREFPAARLVRKRRHHGYATNCNIGATAAAGRYVLFLNH